MPKNFKIDKPEQFILRFEKLFVLYAKVKDFILKAENISGKVVLTSINEVRNSFDHTFRAILDYEDNNLDHEFDKAERHLKRAGYDACEIIAIFKLDGIKGNLKNISAETLTKIYPEYYLTDKLILNDIIQRLSDARAKKNDDSYLNDSFDEYAKVLEELEKVETKINKHMPSIWDYQRKKRKSVLIKFILTFIFGIISTVLAMYIYDRFF